MLYNGGCCRQMQVGKAEAHANNDQLLILREDGVTMDSPMRWRRRLSQPNPSYALLVSALRDTVGLVSSAAKLLPGHLERCSVLMHEVPKTVGESGPVSLLLR